MECTSRHWIGTVQFHFTLNVMSSPYRFHTGSTVTVLAVHRGRLRVLVQYYHVCWVLSSFNLIFQSLCCFKYIKLSMYATVTASSTQHYVWKSNAYHAGHSCSSSILIFFFFDFFFFFMTLPQRGSNAASRQCGNF